MFDNPIRVVVIILDGFILFYMIITNGKVDAVYVNHGNGSAEKIAQAFRDGGFEVEWDGNDYSCVEIHVN